MCLGLRNARAKQVRRELGLKDEAMVLHSSNLRPVQTRRFSAGSGGADSSTRCVQARYSRRREFSAPFKEHLRRLDLEDQVIVREKVDEIEDYLAVGGYWFGCFANRRAFA